MKTPRRIDPPAWLAWTVLAAALTLAVLPGGAALAQTVVAAAGSDDFPPTLHETGLYAPGSGRRVGADVMAFSPQYTLWSDGADKQRWMRLPADGFIDASDADAWVFPPGTRFWKQFGHDGRPVETRVIERRADGSWHFAAYVWNADGSRAALAPATGIAALPVAGAPGGRYTIPSRDDCLACHGATVPVLGVGALQLSPDRDPLAPHATARGVSEVDLRDLLERGLLRYLPIEVRQRAPRIAAQSPVERAALGYLLANCAHCHNAGAERVPVRLTLSQSVVEPQASRDTALRSAVNASSRFRPSASDPDPQVVVPGNVDASVLALRMASRDPQVQMPPLGSQVSDALGLALVRRWIDHPDLSHRKERLP